EPCGGGAGAGSFPGGVKQLRPGPPAVSKTIAQLEERLGVRLLLRSTHGLSPTEAGRNFYDRAKRAIEEADEAEVAARGAGAALSGRLRVCAAVTFARLHVMPRLPPFLAEHPVLDVRVRGARPCHRLRLDVRAGAQIRRGESRVGGLAVAAARSMGGFSDGTAGEREGAGVCELHRTSARGRGCSPCRGAKEARHVMDSEFLLSPIQRSEIVKERKPWREVHRQ